MKKYWLALVAALLCAWPVCGNPVADSRTDGMIGPEYGASKAQDDDRDGACAGTGMRGDLLDFHAFNHPGASTNSPDDDEWYIAFTVDSSFPLDRASGDFWGQSATNRVTYLIGIDVGCDDSPRFDMNSGTPWRRFFGWGCDYFIGIFPVSEHKMLGLLYDHQKNYITSFDVNSRLLCFRRYVEFALPNGNPALPPALKNNRSLCFLLVSTYDTDGTPFNGGRVIDAVGLGAQDAACSGRYITFSRQDFVDTMVTAKLNGRPTDAGANDRQCTTFPRRDHVTALDSKLACDSGPFGLRIDGVVDTPYTHLTESEFAAPYMGGSRVSSDFIGETAAFKYHYEQNGDKVGYLNGNGGADIRQVYAHADTNYLYLVVNGPDALGWINEPDLMSLFVAIDMPGRTSGTDVGQVSAENPNAPARRWVNFRGWDPDFALELWQKDQAILWSAAGNWSSAQGFQFVGDGQFVETRTASRNLYFGRVYQQYEFAIPWERLGGPPATMDGIKLGVYTTGDENIGRLGNSNWDVYDQAPGIGQGTAGFGAHERIGDDPIDHDSEFNTSNSDATPYLGRTDGWDGTPNFWQPASDCYNRADRWLGGTPNFRNADVDTIEEYFILRVDPDLFQCRNCRLEMDCPPAQTAQCGSLLLDLASLAHVRANSDCGAVVIEQRPPAGTVLAGSGVTNVTIIAEAQSGEFIDCTVTVSVRDDLPPVLHGVPGAYLTDCGELPPPPEVTAHDLCDGEVEVVMTTELKSLPCPLVFTRTWTARDSAGNTTSAVQTLTFLDNQGPALVGVPVDATVECDAIPRVPAVTAIDNCHSNLQVRFRESSTGECNRVITRIWTASDRCGNHTSATQTITVVDTTPPVFTGYPEDETYNCADPGLSMMVEAVDNCDTNVNITYRDWVEGVCPRTYYSVWTATDDCGNSAAVTQRVSVIDTGAPQLVGVPAGATASCDAIPSPAVVSAFDDCDREIAVSFTETVAGDNPRIITRTWSAVDECGNTAASQQVLQVYSSAPPAVECPGLVVLQIGNNGTAILPNLAAQGVLQSPSAGTVIGLGETAVTLTATNECGASATCITTVRVESAGCTLTQGYWKNHEEAWPLDSLTLGGVTYSKAQALAILQTPPRQDATYILIHQLMAARLNVANGASIAAVASALAEADTWLSQNPLGSDPQGAARTAGIELAALLDAYNNGLLGPGHCSGDIDVLPPQFDVDDNPFNALPTADIPATQAVSRTADGRAWFDLPMATDRYSWEVAISAVPPPGSVLPAGQHMVVVTAMDPSGNSTTDSFSLTVAP